MSTELAHGAADLRGRRFHSLVKAAASSGLRLASAFLQFLATILIARSLGDEAAGSYFFIAALVISSGQVATFGLDKIALRQVPRLSGGGLVRFVAFARRVSVAISVAIGLILAGYVFATQGQSDLGFGWFLLLPAALAGLALCRVNGEVLKGRSQPVRSVVVRHALSTGLFLAGLVLLGSQLTIELAVLCLALGFVLSAAIAQAGFVSLPKGGARAPMGAGEVRETLGEGFPLWVTASLRALASIIPLAILESCHPSADVAYLTSAYRIFVLFELLSLAVHSIAMPTLSLSARDGDWARFRSACKETIARGALLLGGAYIGVFLLAEPVMGVFGEGFAAAVPSLRVLMVAGLVALLMGPVEDLLLMTGQTGRLATYTLFRLVLTVVAAMLVVPSHGAIGLAYVIGANVIAFKAACLWSCFAGAGQGRNSVVEFVGVAGAGKTFLCGRLADMVEERGLADIRIVAHRENELTPKIRLSKLLRALSFSVGHGVIVARLVQVVRRSGQDSLGESIRKTINLLSELGRSNRRGEGLLLSDQGVVQAIWSLAFRAEQDVVVELLSIVEPWLPERLVVVEVDRSRHLEQLRSRKHGHSRLDQVAPVELSGEIDRGTRLLSQIVGHWRELAPVGHYIRYPEDCDCDPERLLTLVLDR